MKLYYIPQNLTTFSIILIVAKRFVSCKLLLKSAVNILRNILQISDVCESKKRDSIHNFLVPTVFFLPPISTLFV